MADEDTLLRDFPSREEHCVHRLGSGKESPLRPYRSKHPLQIRCSQPVHHHTSPRPKITRERFPKRPHKLQDKRRYLQAGETCGRGNPMV